jgi:hypothetical protein
VEKDEVELAQNMTTEYGNITFRNAGMGIRKKEGLGLANTADLMKELFSDLRRGTGSTVISSAGGVEYAMESSKWNNGLFTFCVLNGLSDFSADINKDKKIMLSELQQFVRKEVSRLSGGKQMPTSRLENLSMDYRVW